MMKTMKSVYLTSLLLLAAISATAQEDYYDDVYFSTKSKKRERTDERRMSASDRPASRPPESSCPSGRAGLTSLFGRGRGGTPPQ